MVVESKEEDVLKFGSIVKVVYNFEKVMFFDVKIELCLC